MTKSEQPPWASGPGEILRHGLELLKKDTDVNRRLAMILVDNAVELMLKTYLGLPKRITDLDISRSTYQEFCESFPKLLDALEEYASDKIEGINVGEIEWYHRLRNELYHQGNGLTVERDKVEVYAELANVLFSNLFGFRLVQRDHDETVVLGNFMAAWVSLEKSLWRIADSLRNTGAFECRTSSEVNEVLLERGILSRAEFEELRELRTIRNEVVYGQVEHKAVLGPCIVEKVEYYGRELEKRLPPNTNQ